jgi:hypothetical protein
MFNQAILNGSYISALELGRAMEGLGERLSEEEVIGSPASGQLFHLQIDEMMRWADKDGDGLVRAINT